MKTKTLTIDFDTYRQELLDEKKAGFEVLKELKSDINQIAKDLRGYDRETVNAAVYKLEYIITQLNKVKIDEPTKQLDLPIGMITYTSGQD